MRMKRKVGLIVFAALIMAAFCVNPAMAVPKKGKVPNGLAGKSANGKLYLFEKDPDTWDIVKPGAWGKMNYKFRGDQFKFNFKGHSLEQGVSYTLIYYPDPWPGAGLVCLGSAVANRGGNVHIKGKLERFCDLLSDSDENRENGIKIWLVLTDDIDASADPMQMKAWNPGEYLFEYDLIHCPVMEKPEIEKSPIGNLYLFEKDPDSWNIVNPGARGRMKYNLWGEEFEFKFDGCGLKSGISYTLIYYPDPWPGAGLVCLGSAVANGKGDVHIKGKLEGLCDLPADYDENSKCGAKIWLVLTDDIDASADPMQMKAWNPGEYLFEYDLIRYDNPDCEYPEPEDAPSAQ